MYKCCQDDIKAGIVRTRFFLNSDIQHGMYLVYATLAIERRGVESSQ